jgi:hypothetical protein
VLSASRSSRAVLSTGCTRRTTSRQCARTASCSEASSCSPGRCGGAEGLVATVSRSSRAVSSTGRTRRTTSRQCARTASCSEASSCGLGRCGGAEGLTATVSRSSRECCQPVVRSEPLRNRAGASAPIPRAAISYSSVIPIPRFEGNRAGRRRRATGPRCRPHAQRDQVCWGVGWRAARADVPALHSFSLSYRPTGSCSPTDTNGDAAPLSPGRGPRVHHPRAEDNVLQRSSLPVDHDPQQADREQYAADRT